MPASTGMNGADAEADHIAIVGLSNRFAGDFSDAEKLWESLLLARCAVTPIPKDRFNADAFYHPDPEHGGTVSRLSPSTIEGYAESSHNSSLFKAAPSYAKIQLILTAGSSTL
jgi:acyl transferase domain-containing protein